MTKFVWLVAALCFVIMSAPASADLAVCKQHCATNCSGKGNLCLNKCGEKCAVKYKN